MNSATICRLETLVPQLQKICDHNVSGEPLGTMCGCTALTILVKQLKAASKEYIFEQD